MKIIAHSRLGIRKWVSGLTLSLTIAWLFWGQQENMLFGEIAKNTSVVFFALLPALFLVRSKGLKKQSLISSLYILSGFLALIVAFSASNMTDAVLVRASWLISLVSAAIIVSCIQTHEDIEFAFKSIALGYIVVLASMVLIIITGPDVFWRGRITFGGSNPNQSSSAAVLGSLFIAYLALKTRSLTLTFFLSFMVMTMLVIAFFSSRQNFVGGAFGVLVLIMLSKEKLKISLAVLLPLILALQFATIDWALSGIDHFQLDAERFGNDNFANRFNYTTRPYIPVFLERPFFGIIGASENWNQSKYLDFHPHNALMLWLYFGGIVFGGPIILTNLIAILRASRARFLRPSKDSNLELNLLFSMLISVKFQWLFSFRPHHPTFDMAFVYSFGIFMALSLSQRYAFGRAMANSTATPRNP